MVGLLDRWSKKQAIPSAPKKETKTEAKKEKAEVKSIPVAEKKLKQVAGHHQAYKILVRPLVTEKAAIAESHNKYSFVVARSATKDEVKRAILEAYGVMPSMVRVINVDGRRVRFGAGYGRRSDYKKAIITLPKGKTISIHEGV